MIENGLHLSHGEKILRRYDFQGRLNVADQPYDTENSLIITDNRVIRREITEDSFSEREILLRDVNQVSASCQTRQTGTRSKTDPKRIVLYVIGTILLLLFFSLEVFFSGMSRKVMGVVFGIMGIICLIAGSKIKKKTEILKRTFLTIKLYDRENNYCVMSIEMAYDEKAEPTEIANEIGEILFRMRSGEPTDEITKSIN